jgi:heptosyltransferase-2
MQPEKILVRGVNWLGDAVMTTPALQRLREAHPAATITILTPAKLKDLWLNHSDLDRVLPFEPGEGVFAVARRIRKEGFTLGVIFPNSPRSALELFLGGVRRRVGYARPWRNWCLTDAISADPALKQMRKRSVKEIQALIADPKAPGGSNFSSEAHHIHNYLRIVEAIGGSRIPASPRIVITEEEVIAFRQRCYAYFTKPGVTWFGLNPGAEYGPAKRWPAEYYIEAATALSKKTGCHWMIFGSKGDSLFANKIGQAIDQALERSNIISAVHDFSGQTTLRELCILLKMCSVVLTNDSGPMHLAAAIGVPVVVPFGSTSPELTGPGLPGSAGHALLKTTAPCAPCFLRECPIDFRCMREHTVEKVVAAALGLLIK